MAASLSAGQSRKLTTGLTGATLIFGAEAADFIQWGGSAWYDPLAAEVGFIGKRHSSNPYHWLVYSESANAWTNDRAIWSADPDLGHGYDQNTIDPATGDVYFRSWAGTIQKFSGGAWSTITAPSPANIVGGLSWWPGVGLMYADGRGLKRYSGGSWSSIQTLSGGSYHDFSEHNATADVLIFGGGNESGYYKCDAALTVSSITPPTGVSFGGASTQGVLISDPASTNLIGWSHSGGSWHRYNITGDSWHDLSAASGDGSNPTNGLPNWGGADTGQAVIACPIDAYGVQMWVRYKGAGGVAAEVWLYKHS